MNAQKRWCLDLSQGNEAKVPTYKKNKIPPKR